VNDSVGITPIIPISQILSFLAGEIHPATLITSAKPLQLPIARTYHKEHRWCIKPQSVCNTNTSHTVPAYRLLSLNPAHITKCCILIRTPQKPLLFFTNKEIFPAASPYPKYMGVSQKSAKVGFLNILIKADSSIDIRWIYLSTGRDVFPVYLRVLNPACDLLSRISLKPMPIEYLINAGARVTHTRYSSCIKHSQFTLYISYPASYLVKWPVQILAESNE
jgi:hypothetical protein